MDPDTVRPELTDHRRLVQYVRQVYERSKEERCRAMCRSGVCTKHAEHNQAKYSASTSTPEQQQQQHVCEIGVCIGACVPRYMRGTDGVMIGHRDQKTGRFMPADIAVGLVEISVLNQIANVKAKVIGASDIVRNPDGTIANGGKSGYMECHASTLYGTSECDLLKSTGGALIWLCKVCSRECVRDETLHMTCPNGHNKRYIVSCVVPETIRRLQTMAMAAFGANLSWHKRALQPHSPTTTTTTATATSSTSSTSLTRTADA